MNRPTNTFIAAGDVNYLWGLYMLVASIRLNKMNDPIIIYAEAFSDKDAVVLEQFENVRLIRMSKGMRSTACMKPAVMLEAKTDFVTWVDCDGYFHGNCEHLILPPDENSIHMRMRGKEEMLRVYNQETIPENVVHCWRKDLNALDRPMQIETVGVSNYLSLSTKHTAFIRQWQMFMEQVLPKENVGTINSQSIAYHMIDESALNALLALSDIRVPPTETFLLDKDPEHIYIHFGSLPKPWMAWTKRAWTNYDSYVGLLDRAQEQGYAIPNNKRPLPLDRRYKVYYRLFTPFASLAFRIKRRILRRLK